MTTKPTVADSPKPNRARSRKQTEITLREALARLQSEGGHPSISALAREVGVSPALIHNRYPDVAEALRASQDPLRKSESLRSVLEAERLTNQDLRTEIDELRRQVRALASVNEALRREAVVESAIAGGKVVSIDREYRDGRG